MHTTFPYRRATPRPSLCILRQILACNLFHTIPKAHRTVEIFLPKSVCRLKKRGAKSLLLVALHSPLFALRSRQCETNRPGLLHLAATGIESPLIITIHNCLLSPPLASLGTHLLTSLKKLEFSTVWQIHLYSDTALINEASYTIIASLATFWYINDASITILPV